MNKKYKNKGQVLITNGSIRNYFNGNIDKLLDIIIENLKRCL